jgi:hypothetical protein
MSGASLFFSFFPAQKKKVYKQPILIDPKHLITFIFFYFLSTCVDFAAIFILTDPKDSQTWILIHPCNISTIVVLTPSPNMFPLTDVVVK